MGKQIRRFRTWTLEEGLTPSKARKAAERAADAWEQEVRAEYQKEKDAKAQGRAYSLLPEKRKDDFVSFVNHIWFAVNMCGGDAKPSTIAFYEYMTKPILEYFNGAVLQDISPVDIQKYFVYLRTEHKTKAGKPFSTKSLRHQYVTLTAIFGYAEKQEMIAKNPMRNVDAPKQEKKPVDALTQEQAQEFFKALSDCPLDFRCILQLLITTGMRRGECLGLQWGDIDEKEGTITISRNVSYTPKSGTIVNTPKTTNSVRTIPVMESTLCLLRQLKNQMENEYPDAVLNRAFLFPKCNEIYLSRDPNSVTRRVKRFMKNNGFSDLSPHDLRHTCASLLLANEVPMKQIQIWLGHSNFSTIADIYAHLDMSAQMETGDVAGAFYAKPDRKPSERISVLADSDAGHEPNADSQTEEATNPKPYEPNGVQQTSRRKESAVCTAKKGVETCTKKTSSASRSPKKGTAKCRKPKTPQTV